MEFSHFSKFNIPLKDVLLRLGYVPKKTKLTNDFLTLVEEEIKFAKKIVIPQKAVNISTIKIINDKNIVLDGKLKIKSKKITLLLKSCVKAYSFAVTIGKHLEEKRDIYLNEKENTRALTLDAIGSVAVEEIAEIVNLQIIKDCAKQNLKTTKRFSPGYGDWDLMQQKIFLNFLGADKIGIKLTPGFTMFPEKSVSAILGVYAKDNKNKWEKAFA